MQELTLIAEQCVNEHSIGTFDEHTIAIIEDTQKKDSGFLKPIDLNTIKLLKDEIQHDFETQTIWRTDVEARASVLNDFTFPTPHAKFHQCKREQLVQFEQLTELSFSYQTSLIELEEVELQISVLQEEIQRLVQNGEQARLPALFIEKYGDSSESNIGTRKLELQIAKLNIQRNKLLYTMRQMQLQAKDRVREVKMWSDIKTDIVKTSPQNFDKDDRDAESIISYALKLAHQYYFYKTQSNEKESGYHNVFANLLSFLKIAAERNIMPQIISKLPQDIINFLIAEKILGKK